MTPLKHLYGLPPRGRVRTSLGACRCLFTRAQPHSSDGPGLGLPCQAEGDYRLVNGRWVETANPLHEAMAVTAKALDMLLYELPHHKPGRVQVDVYMTMREPDRVTERVCILSTTASR